MRTLQSIPESLIIMDDDKLNLQSQSLLLYWNLFLHTISSFRSAESGCSCSRLSGSAPCCLILGNDDHHQRVQILNS